MIDIPDSLLPKDEQGQTLCPKCKKLAAHCDCPSYEKPKPKTAKCKPVVRFERSGRKGKVVTLILRLPRDEAFLKNLSKSLKVKTGSGGTFYQDTDGGVIEIQGDKRKIIEQLLLEEGY